MPHFRPAILSKYLLNGQLISRGCLRRRAQTPSYTATLSQAPRNRCLHTETEPKPRIDEQSPNATAHVPLRQQLKDEAKRQKAAGQTKEKEKGKKKKAKANNQVVEGWELTVGIEIHAQLNTARKLFSRAAASTSTSSFLEDELEPNHHVAFFDVATPGSQPEFQTATLLPALRAALALGCDVQPVSRFDRKHYFHWDQPSGYQLTQYYEPFARHGRLRLLPRDGIAAEDGNSVCVGIRQIQMEQDTAKTVAHPGSLHWIDFNRVGVPLIEIITQPEIHHPATAAAFVRKIQSVLRAVDACVAGMEAGGLRADVNVSVRRTDDANAGAPLGQRTEIKNIGSVKAVEDAIIAERDRQIAVLEEGGTVAGETRGFAAGATETHRLRGKEGEVDYRYMPDPDVAPLHIGDDLVAHLRATMGELPDEVIDGLIRDFGLSTKDAMSLVALNSGLRLEYFWAVVDLLRSQLQPDDAATTPQQQQQQQACFQLAANWILHELGRLTSERSDDPGQTLEFTEAGECARVPAQHLAALLAHLHARRITAKVAKELLWAIFRGRVPAEYRTVTAAIEAEGLWFRELAVHEYAALADDAVRGQEHVLAQFANAKTFPTGKLMFLVGRMIRLGQEERIDPRAAEAVMRDRLERIYVPGLKSGSSSSSSS
ncbi:GatB/GatE catalytic domain-containing protein [Nemania sp. FL0916]|nr:GatB/GatE catalytic domain-containing protein [Nemania sp. FL0916]